MSGKLDAWYFADLKRRNTAEHAKLLAESAKRKFKILEKDLEKEKNEKKRLKQRVKP